MNKQFLSHYKKDWKLIVIRASNKKEYIAWDLLNKIRKILLEWDNNCISYQEYSKEEQSLLYIIKKYWK